VGGAIARLTIAEAIAVVINAMDAVLETAAATTR
jgi:hypothetical protein